MDNRLKIAAAAVVILGLGVGALVFSGVLNAPTAAERGQARTLTAQAQTAYEGGDQDAALQALDQAVELANEDEALRLRASIYVARANYDGALGDISRVIGRGSAGPGDYSLRCWLRARGDQLDSARRDCDRALEMDSGLASAFGNRGLVGLRQGRHIEAWEDFNTALRVGGSDEWVSWRLFGRGLASSGKGDPAVARQDMQTALIANPGVAAQYAEFGLGREEVRQFDDATFAAAMDPRSLISLQQYLYVYPDGAHVAEAQAQIAEIYAWIAEDQAAGRQTVPGFSLAQARGTAGPDDSFGAIGLSRSRWRVAFVTDYADPVEAERAAAAACNASGVRDCEAYAFRNVCAAMAISPNDRRIGMAWAHGEDDAVRTSIQHCRSRGGQACVPVHSQCTPTPPEEAPAPATQ